VLLGLAGVVAFTAEGCAIIDSHGDYGNTVTVRAADGTCARFAHLSTVAVVPGQVVALGALIGTVGSSGHSTGFHLRYQREVCETGRSVPSRFVEAGVPLGGVDVTSALPAGG
jgi:peptidase M23-like protein